MRYVGRFKTIKEDTIRVEINSGRLPRSEVSEVQDTFTLPPSNQINYITYRPVGDSAYTRAAISGGAYAAWIETSKIKSTTQTNGQTTTFGGKSYTGLRLIEHITDKNSGTITYGGEINMISSLFYGDGNVEQVFLPLSCDTLGDEALCQCYRMTTLRHGSLKRFGARCLYNCSSLVNFKFLPYSQIEFIGEEAFASCTNLKIENLIINCPMGQRAFRDCRNIIRLEVHDYSIPESCFESCESLVEVELYGVPAVEENAFRGSFNLAKFTLLDGIPSLGGENPANTTFYNIKSTGLIYCDMEDPYTTWLSNLPGWTVENGVEELLFAGEAPVMIEQSSSDGLFTPIKSRACTITILTEIPYYDMYTSTVQGTSVEVQNTSTGEVLFSGYLTPCQYNQPYVGLDELEIEAVDKLSSLEDIKYEYIGGSTSIISIIDIIKYLIHNVAGYTGSIYAPVLMSSSNSYYKAFEQEYISDENFYDDDDEHTPWSCYEILEEICKIYGVSIVPYGEDVYFIDARVSSRHSKNFPSLNQTDNGKLNYYNYDTGETVEVLVKKEIGLEDYLGDQHDIELDDVYNKISVSANIYEIDKDDILEDPLEDTEKEYIPWSSGSYWYHIADSDDFRITTKAFRITDGQKWRSRFFAITNTQQSNANFIEHGGDWDVWLKEVDSYNDGDWSGDAINTICALPSQHFSYDCTTTMPYKADWNDCFSIFTQPKRFNDMHPQTYNDYNQWGTNIPDWFENYYLKNYFAPLIEYVQPEPIRYNAIGWNQRSYLVFKGDLQYGNNHDHYSWSKRGDEWWYLQYPLSAINVSEINVKGRNRRDANFNKGWEMLYCQLQIGNKYWNGQRWQDTACRFGIPYHKKNVVNEDEYLTLFGWNKPVVNHTYEDQIEEDGFAIPMFNLSERGTLNWGGDVDLFGKLKFTIFTPIQPWDYQFQVWGSTLYQNLKKMNPIIYMQGVNLLLKTVDLSVGWFHKNEEDNKAQDEDQDDVIYSNIINLNNVKELDDIEVKINTYWKGKPNARSYIIVPYFSYNVPRDDSFHYLTEGFRDPYTNEKLRPEEMVVSRYYEHYSSPKKKYNCQVRSYYKPYYVCEATAIGPTRFIVDAQDYDVKSDQNTISLIEY